MQRSELERLIGEIRMEDLPASYQPVAEAVGVEAAIRLSMALGGVPVYLPKLERLLQSIRDRRIVTEFDGANYRELARRYNLSQTRVREIIHSDRAQRQQGRLFETG
ncbi:MAG: DNA-binding protein [Firmicutes bacterium]|nr:DNA-binding protein [Bacillota bacterium]